MKAGVREVKFFLLGLLIFLNILAWLTVYDLNQSQSLEVNFFDVGQGDAIFIKDPKLHQVLIDGGPDSTVLEKLGKEIPSWDNTLDLIILTHPEKDHLAGLIEVLKRYKVENILWTGVVRDTAEYKEWKKLIEEEGAKIFIAKAGQKIYSSAKNITTSPGNVIEILYPFESLEGKTLEDSNNTSIIIRLVFGENSFLLTGDAYQSAERAILQREINIDSDVLKVGHHGSKTSSSEEFIEKVSPEIAVIPVGRDNPYGHPYPEVLETLAKYGIRILRTDLNGDIKILCDSQSLKLK